MFLHCFFQRRVSAVAMSHLQVDHFFLCKANRTINNAIVIVIDEISYNAYKIELKIQFTV